MFKSGQVKKINYVFLTGWIVISILIAIPPIKNQVTHNPILGYIYFCCALGTVFSYIVYISLKEYEEKIELKRQIQILKAKLKEKELEKNA